MESDEAQNVSFTFFSRTSRWARIASNKLVSIEGVSEAFGMGFQQFSDLANEGAVRRFGKGFQDGIRLQIKLQGFPPGTRHWW